MVCTTLELRDKDVINVCNGQRLGRIVELEIDIDCNRVTAIIVGHEGFVSAVLGRNQIRIPWERITKIGKDAVLVELQINESDKCDGCKGDREGCECAGKKKHRWLGF